MNVIQRLDVCFFQTEKTISSKVLKRAIDENDLAGIANSTHVVNRPFPNDNQLPLIYAIRENKIDFLKVLLQNGALPLENQPGELSPIEYAILAKKQEALVCLISHMTLTDIEKVEKALEHQPSRRNIHQAVQSIEKAYSARQRQALIAEVDNKLDQNFYEITKSKETILHLAIQSNSLKLLETCLADPRSKALIDQGDKDGRSPLHYAVALKNIKMTNALCLAGAKIDAKDYSDLNPLMLIGADAEVHHPLRISLQKQLIFAFSTAIWIANLNFSRQLDNDLRLPLHLLEVGLQITPSFYSFSDWQSVLTNVAMFAASSYFSPSQGPLGVVYTGVMTSLVAASALKGLSNCWKYRELGISQALKKAVIVEGPKLTSVYRMIHTIGSAFGGWKPFLSDVLRQSYHEDSDCNEDQYGPCMAAKQDTATVCHSAPSQICDQAKEDFEKFLEKEKVLENLSCDSKNHAYNMECYTKRREAREVCHHWNWKSTLKKECEEATQTFKKIQETESLYEEAYVQCEKFSNDYDTQKDCQNLGAQKIQKCFEKNSDPSCAHATNAFTKFLEKPPSPSFEDLFKKFFFGNFNYQKQDSPLSPAEKKFAIKELGLKEDFTKKECNQAFRNYSLKNHPDKKVGKKSESFSRVSAVIKKLCSEVR